MTRCTLTPQLLIALCLTVACGDKDLDSSACIDEAERNWYPDIDGDGYGDADGELYWGTSCDHPADMVDIDGDCDDRDLLVHPGAEELCGDGIDNDCDGAIDDTLDEPVTYYADADDDGYGDPEQPRLSTDCAPPEGYVQSADDCDDANPEVHPGARELCDLLDNDCDGEIDGEVAWYADADADGHGDPEDGVVHSVCDPEGVEGRVRSADDCDDGDASVHPGAEELCGDGVDNDCDGEVEDESVVTWYADQDGDGYGDPAWANTAPTCEQPQGYVDNAEDCADASSAVYPGAPEICDGVGNDCEALGDWEEASEDGMVSFHSAATGAWTDLSAEPWFNAATPLAYDIEEDGALYFCEGDFYANLNVLAEDVSLVGVGPERSTLHGPGRIVTVDHDETNLQYVTLEVSGLTLTGGDATEGGALLFRPRIAYGNNLELSDLRFEDNYADSTGGAAYVMYATSNLREVDFVGNESTLGGALYIWASWVDGSQLTLEDNSAPGGSGGSAYINNALVALEDSEIRGGDALAGGAFYLYGAGALLTLSSALIEDCSAENGGAINLSNGGVTITDSTLLYNTASDGGGAIYMNGATLNVYNTDISNNSAGAEGGAIHAFDNSGNVVINLDQGSSLTSNIATAGGAIYTDLPNNNSDIRALNIYDALIQGNYASENGGGIYARDTEITAMGDVSEAQGCFSNSAGSAGGDLFLVSSILDVTDWDLADPDDSSAQDGEVYVYNVGSFSLGADASFSCDNDGCQ